MKYLKPYHKLFESISESEIYSDLKKYNFVKLENFNFSAKEVYQLFLDDVYTLYIMKRSVTFGQNDILFPKYEFYAYIKSNDEGLGYLDNLNHNFTNLYKGLNQIERAIKLAKKYIFYENLGEKIKNNEEYKDILTNFLDNGYSIDKVKYGFTEFNFPCNAYNDDFSSLGDFLTMNTWNYALYLSKLENQSNMDLKKHFDIFNHYLSMIGLKSELHTFFDLLINSENEFIITIKYIKEPYFN